MQQRVGENGGNMVEKSPQNAEREAANYLISLAIFPHLSILACAAARMRCLHYIGFTTASNTIMMSKMVGISLIPRKNLALCVFLSSSNIRRVRARNA